MTRQFLFLTASARAEGNALSIARKAAARLPADVPQVWRDLTQPALPPFEDLRHGASYGPPGAVAADLCAATLAASDIVLVTPLYWYALPAPAKLYLDHWSHWMRLPDLGFKPAMAGKRMWLILSHAGSTPAEIYPAVEGLRLSADYMNMIWGGTLLVDANAPGEWRNDPAALAAAERFFPA